MKHFPWEWYGRSCVFKIRLASGREKEGNPSGIRGDPWKALQDSGDGAAYPQWWWWPCGGSRDTSSRRNFGGSLEKCPLPLPDKCSVFLPTFHLRIRCCMVELWYRCLIYSQESYNFRTFWLKGGFKRLRAKGSAKQWSRYWKPRKGPGRGVFWKRNGSFMTLPSSTFHWSDRTPSPRTKARRFL